MDYIGLQKQINQNNVKSVLLLLGFPLLILVGTYLIFFFGYQPEISIANREFIQTIPFVSIGVTIWFFIAYLSHSSIIKLSTGAKSLSRKENMRVYNLTENLCMSVGMTMPKLQIINSPALNAFASGLNRNTYSVTLTSGIINALDDDELSGVIAHELTHIRNKDVRLLIISVIFVGIFSFATEIILRSFLYRGRNRENKIDPKIMLIAIAVATIGYFLSILFRFALSRKREYLADAGAVEMTRNSHALASALRKISGNHDLAIKSQDVKQMCIENKPSQKNLFSKLAGLFATHPPIEKRIAILEHGL